MSSVVPRVRKLSGAQGDVPFIAVVREVAPTKTVKEDGGAKGLGLGEFQLKYFGGNPTYWDETQSFVKEMGSRPWKLNLKATWYKPWEIWSEITGGLKKLKDKGVEGNFVGDGLIEGGVVVIGPGDQGVTFVHFEQTGVKEMPADAIVQAVESFKF